MVSQAQMLLWPKLVAVLPLLWAGGIKFLDSEKARATIMLYGTFGRRETR
jgi:hypothetical protein